MVEFEEFAVLVALAFASLAALSFLNGVGGLSTVVIISALRDGGTKNVAAWLE